MRALFAIYLVVVSSSSSSGRPPARSSGFMDRAPRAMKSGRHLRRQSQVAATNWEVSASVEEASYLRARRHVALMIYSAPARRPPVAFSDWLPARRQLMSSAVSRRNTNGVAAV